VSSSTSPLVLRFFAPLVLADDAQASLPSGEKLVHELQACARFGLVNLRRAGTRGERLVVNRKTDRQ